MEKQPKLVLVALVLASGAGWLACLSGESGHVGVGTGAGGAMGAGTGGTGDTGMGGSGNNAGTGGTTGGNGGAGGTAGTTAGAGGTMGGMGGSATGGAGGAGGITGAGGSVGAGGAGGSAPPGPINVLIWNTALVYGHAARVNAIQYLKAREASAGISFDTTYAHLPAEFPNGAQDGPSDTRFDASVFTDAGLAKYDVVFFLDTTGNSIDDSMRDVRRQALRDFIEKKGRGFVGTHSATDTYQGTAWPWYVDFLGANFASHANPGTPGTATFYQNMTHPILTAAAIANPWNRSEEWYTFTRDPLSSMIPGIKILLTCHDTMMTQERDITWVHEMPMMAGAPRAGRMFYTAFGHATSAFQEQKVMDMIIAGIKWAAYRL